MVLIFKGMTVGVLSEDCVFTSDDLGEMNVNLVISTAYNVIPIWIRIACDNFKQAKLASKNIKEEWNEDVDKQKALLIAELAPSMQVIVSCGIALDALYDTLRPHARLSAEEIQRWKDNGTGRAKQISDVIRRVYKLNNNVFKEFRDSIIQIIKFRDMAVHPSLELKNACNRDDLPIAVDWKFSAFRFSNASVCLISTVNILLYLHNCKSANESVNTQIDNLVLALQELGVPIEIKS
jgi:hypothetical protein